MCQGLLWIEFVMASTRVASVSFRLKRVRRFLNLSMISYVVLVTLLIVLTLRGFQSAYFLAVALNSFIGISAGVLFLYSSHKMAAQHSQRAYITPLICPEGARVPLVDRGLWPQHLLVTIQAKLFARMSSSIKALIIRTSVNASRPSDDFDTSEGTGGRVIRAQLEDVAHMERQLVDLHEKEMRIVRRLFIYDTRVAQHSLTNSAYACARLGRQRCASDTQCWGYKLQCWSAASSHPPLITAT